MLAISIVSAVIAAVSGFIAWRSYDIGKRSAADAKRSADAAEASAEAAKQSAHADAAADHRARTPTIDVRLQSRAGYRPGDTDAIYEVVHSGPEALSSLVLLRPQTDNSVHYTVAATGQSDFGDKAELGPVPIGGRTRFTLSVGPWVDGERLPELWIQLVCSSDSGESWVLPFTLEPPRNRPARIAVPKRIR